MPERLAGLSHPHGFCEVLLTVLTHAARNRSRWTRRVHHCACVFALLSLGLASSAAANISLPVLSGDQAGSDDEPKAVRFLVGEVLHNPTSDGVTVGFMPAEDVSVAIEYGNEALGMRLTDELESKARQMGMVPLKGLQPGGDYQYRLLVRRPAADEAVARELHSFRTLDPPGSTFSFAVLADPHAWAMWTRKDCSNNPTGYNVMRAAMDNIRNDPEIDFVLIGTDSVMTLCGKGCKACRVDGERVAQGDSQTLQDALLRYRAVLSKDIYGRFASEQPMLYMLGDHDGEKGWTIEGGAGEYTVAQQNLSYEARRHAIPNAHDSYGGDPAGAYYALRAGDLLLVVLAAQRYSSEVPMGPENWSLGEAQLIWLEETLANSDARFKIVTAEHLVGGASDPNGPTWKGRGGLTATDNGKINGTFLGEQFLIHEMMKEHGAQLFLSFHDHVVAWGEKVDEEYRGEGVYYAIGGQAAAAGPPGWASLPWYKEAMDYDEDGVPEYQTGTTGTEAKGHFKVTVHGDERLELEYIEASEVKKANGNKVLGFTIEAEPPAER